MGGSQHSQRAFISTCSYLQYSFSSLAPASCNLTSFELCPWGGVLGANTRGVGEVLGCACMEGSAVSVPGRFSSWRGAFCWEENTAPGFLWPPVSTLTPNRRMLLPVASLICHCGGFTTRSTQACVHPNPLGPGFRGMARVYMV